MKTTQHQCHDCLHLRRKPGAESTYLGCARNCMLIDTNCRDSDFLTCTKEEKGIRYLHVEAAQLVYDRCKSFKQRGKQTPQLPDDDLTVKEVEDIEASDSTDDLLYMDPAELDTIEVDTITVGDFEDEYLIDATDTSVVWSVPTSTVPEVRRAANQRLARAHARAREVDPYWCPYCGRTWPGVRLDGKPRRGCPNSRCAGKAFAAKAHRIGAHRHSHLPEHVIKAIKADYKPQIFGYRKVASRHGIDPSTVRDIVQGRTHQEDLNVNKEESDRRHLQEGPEGHSSFGGDRSNG